MFEILLARSTGQSVLPLQRCRVRGWSPLQETVVAWSRTQPAPPECCCLCLNLSRKLCVPVSSDRARLAQAYKLFRADLPVSVCVWLPEFPQDLLSLECPNKQWGLGKGSMTPNCLRLPIFTERISMCWTATFARSGHSTPSVCRWGNWGRELNTEQQQETSASGSWTRAVGAGQSFSNYLGWRISFFPSNLSQTKNFCKL